MLFNILLTFSFFSLSLFFSLCVSLSLCLSLCVNPPPVTLHQKRKLDAVYYYMRSLAASNPILTAKESLMGLFEEAKRKVSLFGPVCVCLRKPSTRSVYLDQNLT